MLFTLEVSARGLVASQHTRPSFVTEKTKAKGYRQLSFGARSIQPRNQIFEKICTFEGSRMFHSTFLKPTRFRGGGGVGPSVIRICGNFGFRAPEGPVRPVFRRIFRDLFKKHIKRDCKIKKVWSLNPIYSYTIVEVF